MRVQIIETNRRTATAVAIIAALLLVLALLAGCSTGQTADQPTATVVATAVPPTTAVAEAQQSPLATVAQTPTAANPATVAPSGVHQTDLVAPNLYTYRVV